MAAAPAVPKTETVNRVTKEGRKLTYCLTVIQQPERARACGSGAKCKRRLEYQLSSPTNGVQHRPTDDLLTHHPLLSFASTKAKARRRKMLHSLIMPTSFSLLLWKWLVLLHTVVSPNHQLLRSRS